MFLQLCLIPIAPTATEPLSESLCVVWHGVTQWQAQLGPKKEKEEAGVEATKEQKETEDKRKEKAGEC